VPSLAFAVGVYLPISSSMPILAGGVVRWLVDKQIRKRLHTATLSEAELIAESDKSPGVLMASGYIAGGAIAGTLIAFYAGFFDRVEQAVTRWAETHNPFYAGPLSDLLSLIPFMILAVILWRAGRRYVPDPLKV
jgi:hypothetical protein